MSTDASSVRFDQAQTEAGTEEGAAQQAPTAQQTEAAQPVEAQQNNGASNVVFTQWDQIFQSPMATAAAIDRIVHHSVILEFGVPSFTGPTKLGSAEQH